MAILSAHVRQHHFPAAVQHRRQSGGGQVHRRERTGCSGQQLRDHPDLHRLCLWLQHRLLGHRVPLLWRKGIRRDEDLGLHLPHRLCGAVRGADGHWSAGLRCPAGAHQHPGGDPCGFRAVSGHLRSGSALHVLLQHCHRHLLCPWRQQDPLLLPCGLVFVQHRRGYPVRRRFQDGHCRCGMGYLPVSGCQLRAGHGGGVPPHPRLPHRGSCAAVLVEYAGQGGRGGCAQHPAAELCLGGQHHPAEHHQHLWRQRHCRLFCRRQAEQHGHYLLYHLGQRHLQLHLPEHGCRQDGPRQGRLWRRPQSGVAAVRAAGGAVLLLWPLPAAAVHERPAGPRH